MLQANIAMGKLKDAISVAKEAVALLPKSTCAYLMMGIVLAQSSQGVVEVCMKCRYEVAHCMHLLYVLQI